MLQYHALFLLLLVGTDALFSWLDVVNLRYGERLLAERADWVRERFAVDEPDRIAAYDRAKTGLSLLQSWMTLLVLLLVLYSGVYADAVAYLQSTGLGSLAQSALFFAGLVAVLTVLSVPFDLYDTFVIEEHFEFNEQTVGLYVRDTVISLVIGAVITAGLGTALLWVIQQFPALWAVGGTILFLVFVLVMQVLYPRVIAPLFNDFTPIESGELRTAVDDVFDRAGFECDQLYEMDASRRSGHSNAYFIGFGRTKRVVLFDTLIEQMSLEEVQSVLAHELAHWKRAHVWKLMGASVVQVGLLLAVAQFLLAQPWLFSMFGVPADATYAGLVLAILWVYPLLQLAGPFTNKLSLAFEREADDFAADITGPEPMVGALSTLGGENLSNPFPHPYYELFHYDHPPIPERIRRLESRDGADEPAGGDDDTTGGDGATPA